MIVWCLERNILILVTVYETFDVIIIHLLSLHNLCVTSIRLAFLWIFVGLLAASTTRYISS